MSMHACCYGLLAGLVICFFNYVLAPVCDALLLHPCFTSTLLILFQQQNSKVVEYGNGTGTWSFGKLTHQISQVNN